MVEYVELKDKKKFDPRSKTYTFDEVKQRINFWIRFQSLFIISVFALGSFILDKELTYMNLIYSLILLSSYYFFEYVLLLIIKKLNDKK